MTQKIRSGKHYLLASDFDQTLSFNDSGIVLSELLGTSGFEEKVAGLSRIHLAQQGAELAYLLLHDPEYRCVRREHLIETGKRIRLKENIGLLSRMLDSLDGYHFSFYVISAGRSHSIRARRNRSAGPHFRYPFPVRRVRRDRVHHPCSGRVWQSRGARGSSYEATDRS